MYQYPGHLRVQVHMRIVLLEPTMLLTLTLPSDTTMRTHLQAQSTMVIYIEAPQILIMHAEA